MSTLESRSSFNEYHHFLLIILLGFGAAALPLHANPKGGQVTNGTITITEGPGVMTINQATPRGIIHWQDFSIGAGELTQFVHPDSKSATLNRVVGGIPSSIQGTLQANGQVYLVNPNGIVVGPGGRINTAAFVASTLDVPNAEFMAGGNMHFSGNSLQGIVNLGSITATDGDVILMAHTVTNAGTINAPNGVAALAAGNDILLQAAGDERVVVNSGIATGGDGVVNSGTIQAAQAELKAAGGNVYALAVNNSGVIRATGIAQKNGRIILGSAGGVVQNTGELHAKNADGSGGSVRMDSGKGGQTINQGLIDAAADNKSKNGGTVEVLGDTVTVGSTSVIDVSGATAGTVAIGVSADLANQTTATGGIATLTADASANPSSSSSTSAAQQATIQANSRILANSTADGNGGRVVVWSEKQSVVGGTIEANAGANGGNGGLVETSGRTGLTIIPGTKVTTAAPKGKAGTWLLDPAGITVDNNATDTTGFAQNGNTNHVNASDIVTALQSGNVTISTSSSFAGNNDIVVSADILTDNTFPGPLDNPPHPASLFSLNSAGGITINNQIGGTSTPVIMQMQSHGDINIASTGSVQTHGISIFALSGDINIAGQLSSQGDANVFVTSALGSIAFQGTGEILAGTGNVYLETLGFLVPNTTGTISGVNGNVAVSAGGLDIWSNHNGVGTSANPLNTSIDHLVVTVDSSVLTTGGGVFIKNSSASDLHIGGVPNLLSQPSAGILIPTLQNYGGVEINNVASAIRLDSATGERIAAPGNIVLKTGSSSDIQVLNTNANSLVSHFGSVTLNAAGDVRIGNAGSNISGVNVRGETNVDVIAGGDVTVAGSLLKAGGASGLSVTAGGDINIFNSNGFAAIIGTSGGAAINLTTGAGKTFNNNTSSSGGVLTTLPDNSNNAVVTPTGGDIIIKSDNVVINAPIKAGTAHSVSFASVTVNRSVDVGTKGASTLSFSPAELSQITAGGQVNFGSFTATGDFAVSHSIFFPSGFSSVLLLTNGSVFVNQPITLPGNLSLAGGAGVTLTGNVVANNLSAFTTAGTIDASASKVVVNHLQFTANGGDALFSNAQNNITAINTSHFDTSTGNVISIVTTGGLTINGQLGTAGVTNYVYLQPGSNLTFGAGASILSTNLIDLNIGGGSLVNNAGSSALQSPAYRVWQANLYSSLNKEGFIPGTRDTSDKVQFPNSVLADPQVFYYGIVTPPTPPSQPAAFSNSGAGANTTVPVPNPTSSFLKAATAAPDFLSFLQGLSSDVLGTELLAVLTGFDTGLSQQQIRDLNRVYKEKLVEEQQIANEQAAKKNKPVASLLAGSFDRQKQLNSLAAVLGLANGASDLNQDVINAFFGVNRVSADPNYVNPSSLSPDQIASLSRPQMMRLLEAAGLSLSGNDAKLAHNATLSEDNLKAILQAGPLDHKGFAAIVAAGGGNLTIAQIIAAGAGNVVSQGGGNVVSQGGGNVVSQGGGNVVSQGGGNAISNNGSAAISNNGSAAVAQGGGNFKVVDSSGRIITQDGAGLTVNQLAEIVSNGGKLLTSDGASLITSDGAGLLTSDGAGLLTSDGAGLLTSDGASFIKAINSLITSDGAGIVAANKIITEDGAGILGHNGSALIGAGTSTLIGAGTSTLIGAGTSTLIGTNVNSLINTNGSNILGHNGSAVIQLQSGAGIANPAMNNP